MRKDVSPQKIFLLFFSILLPSLVFSNLTQEEARLYREKGYEAQKNGDYEAAISHYQKAIAIDPTYSVVCNDLGILSERMGNKNMAKAMYQRALTIDPNYAEACYNLASIYESEGDFLKAAFYWKQRLRLGGLDSAGTLEAREHLRQIGHIYPHIAKEIEKYDTENIMVELKAMKRAEEILSQTYREDEKYDEVKKLLLQMDRQRVLR